MKLISESELIKPTMLFQVFKLPSVTWPITCQRLCEQDDVIFLHLSLKSLSDSKNVSFHTDVSETAAGSSTIIRS